MGGGTCPRATHVAPSHALLCLRAHPPSGRTEVPLVRQRLATNEARNEDPPLGVEPRSLPLSGRLCVGPWRTWHTPKPPIEAAGLPLAVSRMKERAPGHPLSRVRSEATSDLLLWSSIDSPTQSVQRDGPIPHAPAGFGAERVGAGYRGQGQHAPVWREEKTSAQDTGRATRTWTGSPRKDTHGAYHTKRPCADGQDHQDMAGKNHQAGERIAKARHSGPG